MGNKGRGKQNQEDLKNIQPSPEELPCQDTDQLQSTTDCQVTSSGERPKSTLLKIPVVLI